MGEIFFKPTKFLTEIVGETHTQKAIREIVMYKDIVDKDDMELNLNKILATLILEDDNKFDLGNAVRIDIEGKPVGYLAREDAQRYRRSLDRLNLKTETCTCYASAFGKRPEMGKMMVFGIWLAIDLNNLEVGEKPRKKFLGLF